MNSLPVEVKVMVASFVGDARSLANLALVDRTFYGIFKSHEAKFCAGLTSYTDLAYHGLLPLAMAALDSEHLGINYTDQDIARYIDEHFPYDDSLDGANISDWQNIQTCLELDELYLVVNHYATIIEGIVDRSIAENHDNQLAFSQAEGLRVRKSLYILQILRNLFPPDYTICPVGSPGSPPVWRKFWYNFAPWELQQVRCAHELLAQHLINVMLSESDRADKEAASNPVRHLLQKFISDCGLLGMYSLENHSTVTNAVIEFGDGPVNAIVNLWYIHHDTMWLQAVGPFTIFNTQDVIHQYPESDPGPRDAWLHTLLQGYSDDPMFARGAQDFFSCETHAIKMGWAFWDRERLDKMANGCMPTTEKMLSVGTFQRANYYVCSDTRLRSLKSSCVCPWALNGVDRIEFLGC